MIHRIVLAISLSCCLVSRCLAELKPEEIAIVAARGNRESEALAKYYAKARGVPANSICLVDVPRGETIPRDMWQWGVRPEIHKWLAEHDPQQQIRCLVTVWGMPLRIDKASSDAEARRYKSYLVSERSHRIKLLGEIQMALDHVAPKGELARDDVPSNLDGPPGSATEVAEGTAELFPSTASGAADAVAGTAPPPPTTTARSKDTSELDRLRTQVEQSLRDAQLRLTQRPAGETRNMGQRQLQQLAAAAGGANVILQALNNQLQNTSDPNPDLQSDFDVLRGRATGLAEIKAVLDQTAPGIERDSIVLAIVERAAGMFGTIEWLDEQLKMVQKNETGASFDSELSLVMWPDGYQLLRWQPNYLRPGFENSQLPKVFRTLMVARIDAPTLPLAKGLIDTAIKVEKEGLEGKVYIDARGIGELDDETPPAGSHADYDRALLITAKGIGERTKLEVVLDTSPQLFQPGHCPDAALYCGWYSLAKYVDAFDWRPGAVAYHIASSEAVTLRDPASQAWCKKMLEDGVCATLGPVYEPYLISFPRPNEFFAMLLQGDLTLVECYYRSLPFNSWVLTLIGDPLYRPFKNHHVAADSTDDASGR